MRKGFVYKSGRGIFLFSMAVFSALTVYLVFMGSFFWEGGNIAYGESSVLLRGGELLGGVFILFCLLGLLSTALKKMEERKILLFTAVCATGMLLFQVLFVFSAEAGIRYDALKVYDEAVALFSQKGIGKGDLDGYFARYSNNYAITIMTHWFLKIFRAAGVVRQDFSNGVLVLQLVNVVFVDAAFTGAWAFLRKYAGVRQAAVFIVYMAFNPVSYVWLPFYYTNTCAMAFAVWGAYLLLGVLCVRDGENIPADEDDAADFHKNIYKGTGKRAILQKTAEKRSVWKKPFCCAVSGVLFAIGCEIRATVFIALIAALITSYFIMGSSSKKDGEAGTERKNIRQGKIITGKIFYLALLLFSMGITGWVYGKVEDYYLAFDERDTEFPVTHWIAMGLSDTGTFSPADEAYTMGFETKEEKAEGTRALLGERASGLGPLGVSKLYLKKLALTFGDGAGGYHSELNLSKEYGRLWQAVYGTRRDPLLAITQVFYLLSLTAGLYMAGRLWKGRISREMFFLPLLLLGSYLFQMLWEAGTVYSIGTMYVNGCMVSVFADAFTEMIPHIEGRAEKRRKRLLFQGTTLLCVVLVGAMIGSFCTTDYVEVSMSVDQFLFQADQYIAVSDGMGISQTFQTKKEFSTIALQVHNPEGKYNDSIYSVYLYDGCGNLIKERALRGNLAGDYDFCRFAFKNREEVSHYEIEVRKKWGNHDLIFLYYDTGHYDAYPEGRLTGLTKGNMADLIFRVYQKEAQNGGVKEDRRKKDDGKEKRG